MKEIKLVCDPPFHNSVDVAVFDFPDGPDGRIRQRCKVTVEFAQSDVKMLQQQGMDLEAAMKYYEDWLYRLIKRHLAQDWKCVDGYEELFALIHHKVSTYY